jgi:hypothetical protein
MLKSRCSLFEIILQRARIALVLTRSQSIVLKADQQASKAGRCDHPSDRSGTQLAASGMLGLPTCARCHHARTLADSLGTFETYRQLRHLADSASRAIKHFLRRPVNLGLARVTLR